MSHSHSNKLNNSVNTIFRLTYLVGWGAQIGYEGSVDHLSPTLHRTELYDREGSDAKELEEYANNSFQ